MASLLSSRFAALRLSANVAKTRLVPTSTRSLFVAARPQVVVPAYARTFLSSNTAESPAKKTATKTTKKKPQTTEKPKKKSTKRTTAAKKKSPGRPKLAGAKKAVTIKKAAQKAERVQLLSQLPPGPPGLYVFWYSNYFIPEHGKPASVPEGARAGSAKYKTLTEAEKLSIREAHSKFCKEANEKRDAYLATLPPDSIRVLNNARRQKGKKNVPVPAEKRKPINAYLLYAHAMHPTYPPEMSMIDRSRETGKLWKTLSAAEKKPYEDAAVKAAKEFKAKHSESA